MSILPIEDVLPLIRRALNDSPNVLLMAPPGAGKTTQVPLALLESPWLAGRKILLLEPRRLAARAAAHRMADQLHEAVGETVGYRMRFDTKIGPRTRLEIVTEGVLTRLLQEDPSLAAYGLVLFDEFHERSLQADVGLALCLETQRLFRPELRLLVMSATLNCGPVSELMGHAPLITCEGRLFPVETRYLDQPVSGRLDLAVVQHIRRSLAHDDGSVLVFLPGMADIRRVERMLLESKLGPSIQIAPLHGELPQDMQDAAIRPAAPGSRKIVLATSIAETSLTIEGVRVVIDGGWLRIPRFDPRSGLTRLETIRVTRDSAEQRRGRAGRLEPGICYRLWTEKEQASLTVHRPPEILEADLAPLMLDLAQWGAQSPNELSWLTPPPPGAVAQAKDLLIKLGAFSTDERLTDHGRQMAELPLHPRLAHMLISAISLRLADQACEVAALLSERDVLHGLSADQNADVRVRLDVLQGEYDSGSQAVNRTALERVRRTAQLWRRQLKRLSGKPNSDGHDHPHVAGLLLALAYPDRIAQRQPAETASYRLVNGRGARFRRPDPIATEPFLVIADLDGGGQWADINLAAPITCEAIESLYREQVIEEELVVWDERIGAVRASCRRRLGAITLLEEAVSSPDTNKITSVLLQAISKAGLDVLSFGHLLKQWRARVMWLRRIDDPQTEWPNLSDEALLRTLDQWLGPYVVNITTLDRVKRLDLTAPLHALLTYEQLRRLDRLAPTHITVPSGSRLPVDYEQAESPVLEVRLQEMFGCKDTPCIAGGKIPLMLHLLSPAKRPVQVTQDLGGFWKRSYHDVRKELRGRYPKHHWPEDPLNAVPTAKANRRS
ncbi:MAG: ATP-dependent helicase HrpB [Nitrospira sp.]|nr:MAG: ATP-dependent helicase HrpB [Nitrospira sp.]